MIFYSINTRYRFGRWQNIFFLNVNVVSNLATQMFLTDDSGFFQVDGYKNKNFKLIFETDDKSGTSFGYM